MKKNRKIIITGNHHTPGIELINLLQNDKKFSWTIHYFSQVTPTDTHLVESIIPKLKSNYHNLNSGKFHRRSILKTITGIPGIFTSFLKCLRDIKEISPDITVSFGGYVSVPVVIASWIRHVPVIVHEQTLTNSMATRIGSLFATRIALSFDHPDQINKLPISKTTITGNLLRREVFNENSPTFDKFPKNKKIIYITGGNQGSLTINALIPKIVKKLPNFNFIHQTGKIDFDNYSKLSGKYSNYYPHAYIANTDIGWILKNSDIIISRSGANTCQEIDLHQKKSILIPLPFSQQNEQLLNARWLKSRHPTITIIQNQSSLTANRLIRAITKLTKIPSTNPVIKYHPSHRLVDLIHEII